MLKISDIKCICLSLPTDQWLLVKVETNEGLCGWGEATGGLDDTGLAHLLDAVKEELKNESPLNIFSCVKRFHDWTYPVIRNIRTYSTALSALDQALWDLKARYYGMPLYKLYGADHKDSVPLYANLNKAIRKNRTPEILADHGKKAIDAGFRMVKATPFDEINPQKTECNLAPSMTRLEALLEYVPIEKTAIDCHQRFERYSLARMTECILNRFGIPYWIEDPVEVSDYEAVRIITARYPQIKWAAGEDALDCTMLYRTIHSNCYEIIMPDVKYIGGPSVVRSIIEFGEAIGKKITLHNPNGLIATAHSAHLTALCKTDMMMEYPFMAVPERELLCTPQEVVHDGRYWFSQQPGIGIDIRPEVLKEFGSVYLNGTWKSMERGGQS